MQTWFENEAILQRVREWLSRTEEEVRRAAEQRLPEQPAADGQPAPVGLLQLMEAFTALRHELKLQTKSARGLEETVRTALSGLDRAADHLRGIASRETAAVADALQPLVLSLVDLDEALERGERAFLLLEQRLLQEGARLLDEKLQHRYASLSFFQRWRARRWHQDVRVVCQSHLEELNQRLLGPLREGYELIRARLQRVLSEQGIQRMDCTGLPVDPSRMNVIELVDDPQLTPETVVEELRPGYTWRGGVLRFAEVRAVCRRTNGLIRPSMEEGIDYGNDRRN